ncbi:3-oxoacyl-ACP reductase FabG [Embleya sp. NPDC020886]|uniref:3-oxoacyl-ACP reductase FabG n=1 Tax=Embleya sp. NPDC020886 TaxID=3363980 RepID=UPI00378CB977
MTLPSMDGRRVVVTGGSKGIGKGIAAVFARSGAHVVITGRNAADVHATATELTATGGKVIGIAADVGDPAAISRLADDAVEALGGVDVVCCNAGIFPNARLTDLTAERIDEVFDVNLRGTMLTVTAFLPALRSSSYGRVVVTSSITGPVTGYPGWSHYAASKAGQMGFVRAAALELAPQGITINALLPGNVLTEGVTELGPDYVRDMARSIPMGRLATSEEIGHAALFLASEHAGFITGQGLIVDGGQVLAESLDAITTAGA